CSWLVLFSNTGRHSVMPLENCTHGRRWALSFGLRALGFGEPNLPKKAQSLIRDFDGGGPLREGSGRRSVRGVVDSALTRAALFESSSRSARAWGISGHVLSL